jgi:hypothetical protein
MPGQEVTVEWLEKLRHGLFVMRDDAEARFGDNAAGTYPSEVEMTLLFAHGAVNRELRRRSDAVVDRVAS